MPDQPLEVGEVTAIAGGVATVTLPGGGVIQARGTATVGQRVFGLPQRHVAVVGTNDRAVERVLGPEDRHAVHVAR